MFLFEISKKRFILFSPINPVKLTKSLPIRVRNADAFKQTIHPCRAICIKQIVFVWSLCHIRIKSRECIVYLPHELFIRPSIWWRNNMRLIPPVALVTIFYATILLLKRRYVVFVIRTHDDVAKINLLLRHSCQ